MSAVPGEEALVERFRDEILPKLLREGRLPASRTSSVESCEFAATERGTDHFASCPYFVRVVADDRDKVELDLFVKFPHQDDATREAMHVDKQFYNECKAYEEVLKDFRERLLGAGDLLDGLCPRCFFAEFDDSDYRRSVLVFEDLKKAGFRPAASKTFLDFEHCDMAVRQLARFHAISIAAKMTDPSILDKARSAFIETRYFDDERVVEQCRVFLDKCNQRAIDYLLSRQDENVPKEYVRKFRDIVTPSYDFMRRMLAAEEPLSVLCHGDYCRNNMAFRYDGSRVVDQRMFDFQTSRYGSPAIDLSLLIYLNMTQDDRDKHFDELFDTYHSVLVETAAALADVPKETVADRFPLKLFREDFAARAAYAYPLVSFFQVIMMGTISDTKLPEDMAVLAEILYEHGGENITRVIADVIGDFHKRNFYAA